MREDALLEGVLSFFADRIFGVDRQRLLEDELARSARSGQADVARQVKALQRQIDDCVARQQRLIHTLETNEDPEEAMFRQIRDRFAQLEAERRAKIVQLGGLCAADDDESSGPPELLDLLPVLRRTDLSKAPESTLRGLFESFRLQLRYDKHSNTALCRVTVRDDGGTTELVTADGENGERSHGGSGPTCSLLVRAPGGGRSTSVQDRPADLHRLLIEGGFGLPKSRWAKSPD